VGKLFTNDRTQIVWPIMFLRFFGNFMCKILDIMCLTLFLIPLDCQYFSAPPDQIFYNEEFPDVCECVPGCQVSCFDRQASFIKDTNITPMPPGTLAGRQPLQCLSAGETQLTAIVTCCADCFAMPHMVHAFVAVIALLFFCALAAAFTVGEVEVRRARACLHCLCCVADHEPALTDWAAHLGPTHPDFASCSCWLLALIGQCSSGQVYLLVSHWCLSARLLPSCLHR
jgi:hypothetical protein